MTREKLEAAIKRGIATYVRNTGAPVSETDLFTDIIADVRLALAPVEPATPEGQNVLRLPRATAPSVIEAARSLLELPQLDLAPEARVRRLRRVLDQLAVAYHSLESSSVPTEEHPVPVRTDYATMRVRFAAAFPDLGAYHAVQDGSTPAGTPEVTVGDALDDLTDIALDLEEVLERAKESLEDALWYFQFLFETHWGAHLRFLQLYLHTRG